MQFIWWLFDIGENDIKVNVRRDYRRAQKQKLENEIRRVRSDIQYSGYSVNVCKLVARWYRRKGFRIADMGIRNFSVYLD